jgi:serine/threonine-protein kinase HipA
MSARSLDVLIGPVLVGHLVRGNDERVTFSMVESYKRLPWRPVLSQFFEDDLSRRYRGKPGRLPAFFANLVPEGVLRDVVERQGGGPAGDDFALMALVGQDLAGAVVLTPGEQATFDDERLDEEDEDTFRPRPRAEEGLRFSLAGAQLKFSMIRDNDKLTLPARDQTGQWIVKIAGPRWTGLAENEYSMLEWARAAGFDVPECSLHDAEAIAGLPRQYVEPGTKFFAIRRYDRDGQRRVHQEDFAQAVGLLPEKKFDHFTYAQVAKLAQAFVGDEAFYEVVRRLVFVIVCGNADAHMKNWSLVYPDGITAQLSPLYDQVCTVAWPVLAETLALNVVWKRNFTQIDEAEMCALAERCDESPAQTMAVVKRTLDHLAETWRNNSASWPMPEDHRRALYKHWGRVPLLTQHGFDKLEPAISSARPRRPRREC